MMINYSAESFLKVVFDKIKRKKKLKVRRLRLIALALLYFFALEALCAFPQQINYQGKLTNASNIPQTGSYSIVFTIYDAESDGTNKWTETRTVTTESGFFNVILGASTPIGTDVFDGNDRWLGIKVGADAEMTPRQKLTSVGHAFHAYNADKLDGQEGSYYAPATGGNYVLKTGDTMTGTLTNSADVHVSGNVGIGTDTPGAKLHVNKASGSEIRIDTTGGSNNDSVLSFYENNVDRGKIYWDGNANDFIWSSTLGDIGLIPSGNVGIGTAEPTYKLDVAGDIVIDNGRFLGRRLSGGVVAQMLGYSGNNFEISAYTSVPDRVIIYTPTDLNQGVEIKSNASIAYFRNDGNVGLGTTAPGQKLEVAGGVKAVTFESTATTGTAPFTVASTTLVTNLNADKLDGHDWSEVPSGSDYVLKAGDTMTGTLTNSADVHVSGNVGIGTTSPGYDLDISGDVRWTGTLQGGDIPAARITSGYLNRDRVREMRSVDTRNDDYEPQTYGPALQADFKLNATDGLSDGGIYHGVLSYRPYGTSADFSGGPMHQLGFTINKNLWMRSSTNSTTWGSWKKILDTTADLTSSGNLQVSGAGPHYISAGNVGIGTTEPSAKLDVNGVTGTGIGFSLFSDTTTAGNQPKLRIYGYADMYSVQRYAEIYIDTYGRPRFDSSGNPPYFGTGLTASSLAFGSNNRNNITLGNKNSAYLALGEYAGDSDGTNFIIGRKSIGSQITPAYTTTPTMYLVSGVTDATTEYLKFYHDSNDGRIETGKGDLVLVPSGNVGIGTATPSVSLEVAGDIKAVVFESTATTGTAPLTVASTTLVTNLNADKLDGHDWSEVPSGDTFVLKAGDTMTGALTIEAGFIGLPDSAGVLIDRKGTRFVSDYGTGNLFIGLNSGNLTLSSAANCTGIGEQVLDALTTGARNTAIGYRSMNNINSGFYNTALGYQTLYSTTTGANNTAIGYNALTVNTASVNTAVGAAALDSNTSGTDNTAVGYSALQAVTTTSRNTALGNCAGYSNTSQYNTYLGYYSGYSRASASENTAVGYQAMRSGTSGNQNTAVGSNSLYNNSGSYNIAVGTAALYTNSSGNYNTAVGYYPLFQNTGSSNTAVGLYAGFNCTGSNNTFVGASAGYGGSGAYAGNSNVFLGYNAGYNESGSNKLYIDNSNTSTPLVYGDFSTDFVNINGKLGVGIGITEPASELEVAGDIKAVAFESTVATGTAPLTVVSTTAVTNLNADLLDGYHASDFGAMLTGYVQLGPSSQQDAGTDTYGAWVKGNSYGLHGEGGTYGVYGINDINFGYVGASTTGVYGEINTTANYDAGVQGFAAGASGITYGVKGRSNSSSGFGVYGEDSSSTTSGYLGGASYGAYGINDVNFGCLGGSTIGVYGEINTTVNSDAAVNGLAAGGSGITYGVKGRSNSSSGFGVYGEDSSSTKYGYLGGASYGIYGTDGTNYGYIGSSSYGVYGYSASNRGVQGSSSSGYGVRGDSSTGYGVSAFLSGTTGRAIWGSAYNASGTQTYGGYFNSAGTSGYGVYAENTASTGTNYGLYGKVNSTSGYALYSVGGQNYMEGKLGVGETSPAVDLHVVKSDTGYTSYLDSADVIVAESNGSWSCINIINPSSCELVFSDATRIMGALKYTHSTNSISFRTNSTDNQLTIQSTGRLTNPYAYSTGVTPSAALYVDTSGNIGKSSSSLRYKHDIKNYSLDVDKVVRLRPVEFKWNKEFAGTEKADFGLIAEEVNEVLPELVILDKEGRPDSVRYDMVAVVLLKAYQKKQKETDELKSKVADLESKLNKILEKMESGTPVSMINP